VRDEMGTDLRVRKIAMILLALIMVAVACKNQKPQAKGEGQASNAGESSDSLNLTSATTAYIVEPGVRNGSYVSFSIGKFHIANLKVATSNEEIRVFFQKWIEQINAGTLGGSITFNLGNHSLPLQEDAYLSCVVQLINTPFLDSSGFVGPRGTLTWSGSVKAKKSFDVDNIHVSNPNGAKIELSFKDAVKINNLLTVSAIPTTWDVPAWDWTSCIITIDGWNNTPDSLQQFEKATMVMTRTELDTVTNILSALSQITLSDKK